MSIRFFCFRPSDAGLSLSVWAFDLLAETEGFERAAEAVGLGLRFCVLPDSACAGGELISVRVRTLPGL